MNNDYCFNCRHLTHFGNELRAQYILLLCGETVIECAQMEKRLEDNVVINSIKTLTSETKDDVIRQLLEITLEDGRIITCEVGIPTDVNSSNLYCYFSTFKIVDTKSSAA